MFEEGDIVHRYTRKQAIEDGVLVDLMQPETAELVKVAGFKHPIAMTVGAFSETVVVPSEEPPEGQDVKGRVWDVLLAMKVAIHAAPADEDRVHFKVSVWNGTRRKEVPLWSLCGPGDEGEPVITIMLEGED